MSAPILAVDPGTRKTGYAVLAADGSVMTQGVVPTEDLVEVARAACVEHGVAALILGRGTHARPVEARLRPLNLPVTMVDEHETTVLARALYFADHPPRGWRRLVPVSFQLPPRPIDDYAAILIGRRFLGKS